MTVIMTTTMTAAVTIAIVPERAWRPLVAATPCGAGSTRLHGLLMAVHGRHAGLTPRLAAAILDDDLSLTAAPRRGFAPWTRMREQVAAALSTAQAQGDRFWAEVSPALLYARALVPLVQAAERRTGRAFLFGEDAAATVQGPALKSLAADYAGHQRALEHAFAAVVADRRAMGAAFWDGLAFSVWSEFLLRSGSRAAPSQPHHPAPDADPGIVHWLRRLAPRFAHDRRAPRPRLFHHRVKEREPRPRQGGVAGVRMSHSPDEFGERLLSEAAWPTILQLDRLLHSGYLVRHRPPPLDRRRDVLIAAVFAAPALAAGHSLARAAFLDAAVRAAMLLRRGGLPRSDIVVAARTAGDGAATAAVSIEDLDWLDDGDPWQVDAAARMALLRTPGLLPAFLERGPGAALPPPSGARGYPAVDPDEGDWLRRAVAARAFLSARDDSAAVFARYQAVNVIAVVSEPAAAARPGAAGWRDLRYRIGRELGLGGRGHAVSLILMSAAAHHRFTAVTGDRGAPAAAAAGTAAAAFEGRLVTALMAAMLGDRDGT